jgi:hypothetical protein
VNASELDRPDFWKRFFKSVNRLPVGSDREYELLARVAARAGVSYGYARKRVNDYLAGRLAKPATDPSFTKPIRATEPSSASRQRYGALIVMADNPDRAHHASNYQR